MRLEGPSKVRSLGGRRAKYFPANQWLARRLSGMSVAVESLLVSDGRELGLSITPLGRLTQTAAFLDFRDLIVLYLPLLPFSEEYLCRALSTRIRHRGHHCVELQWHLHTKECRENSDTSAPAVDASDLNVQGSSVILLRARCHEASQHDVTIIVSRSRKAKRGSRLINYVCRWISQIPRTFSRRLRSSCRPLIRTLDSTALHCKLCSGGP